MVKANPQTDQYIAAAPLEQQAAMKWIRKLMRTKLAGVADERCQNGMVVCGLVGMKELKAWAEKAIEEIRRTL